MFLDSNAAESARQRTMEGLPRFRNWLQDYEVGGIASLALERVLQRCQANGIRVLLVAPPVSAAHRALYTPEIEAAFRAELARLTADFPCPFLDYRDRIPDEYFYDNHHLLNAGAALFTQELTQEVILPAWRTLHPERK
jgi:hypothetical protein